MTVKKKVIIAGAGGRDFHNFLVFFKDNPEYEVIAFTASQIPGIEKRTFPKAVVVRARSEITVSAPEKIKGRKCLVVGDGPTLTHGGMSFGAGTIAVKKFGGKIVSPLPFSIGSIKGVYKKFPHLKLELPAMGYNSKQIKELENTINRAKCDVVIDGTPANLSKILKINKPIVNVEYELDEVGDKFEKVLQNFIKTSRGRNL